ncbi:YkgJ family cysteine cluster protein [Planctomycetota bacterium]
MSKPWYHAGLRFECQRCGHCCRGEPGYVWVRDPEIVAIARLLSLSREEFLLRYCRQVFGDISLIERPDGDCIFWSDGGCEIYPVRPVQCRTFPFWREYVRSPKGWVLAATRCPGCDQGPLFTAEEIRRSVNETDS